MYHRVIHRHHIHTRGSGGSDSEENLIRLCPAHHDQVHRGQLVLDGCRVSPGEAARTIEGAARIRGYLLDLARTFQSKKSIRQILEESNASSQE